MEVKIDNNIEITDNNRQLQIRLFTQPIDSQNYISFTLDGLKVLKVMVDRVISNNE